MKKWKYINPDFPERRTFEKEWRRERGIPEGKNLVNMSGKTRFDFEICVLINIYVGTFPKREGPPYRVNANLVSDLWQAYCLEKFWPVSVAMPDGMRSDFDQWAAGRILSALGGKN